MAERPQIRGKVADIEDRFILLINKGENDGVELGMIFAIMDPDGAPVIDPDTGDELGRRDTEKLRVKVIDVYPRFCRAETYRMTSPTGILGGGNYGQITDFLSTFSGRERIANQPPAREAQPTQAVVHVKIGDAVREIAPSV